MTYVFTSTSSRWRIENLLLVSLGLRDVLGLSGSLVIFSVEVEVVVKTEE